jgi:hypothetical protein
MRLSLSRGWVWLRVPLFTFLLVSSVGGCRQSPPPPPAVTADDALRDSPGSYWIRTELFFGLTRRDGTAIDGAQWQQFVDDQVTPRFPDGLTIFTADGQYRDTRQLLHKEPSRVVVILHPPSTAAAANAAIDQIIREYVSRFDQESVLRVDSIEKAALVMSQPAQRQ